MSLINEMLRNLDARAARSRPDGTALLAPAVREPARAARGRARIGGLVGALAGAALVLAWFGPRLAESEAPAGALGALPLPEVSEAPAPPVLATAPAPETTPAAAPAPVPEPAAGAVVRRFALETTAHGTRLSLELSAQTAHRVERSDGGRALEVVLAGTRLGGEIPPLDLQRSPIESFDVEQRDGELHLRLTLAEPARVQSGMQSGDDGARLVLDFVEPPPAAHAPDPELAAAPAPARARAPAPAPAAQPEAAQEPVRTPHAPNPAERAAQSHRRAQDAIASGDRAGAEALLREALELDPALVDARASLISLLLASGRLDDAASLLDQGEVLAAGNSALALLRARLLLARGDVSAAIEALERSAPPLAQNPDYHALHAALLERRGDHARAAEIYQRLVALDARRAPWWLGLGLALENQSRRSDALAAYREASKLASLDAESQGWVESRIAALASGG